MAEYIKRGDAFDAVMGQFCASSDETEEALNGAIEDIRKIPAADVVPVVRCGECRFWTESSAIPTIGTCMFASIRHTVGFFCANGERKGDEGE